MTSEDPLGRKKRRRLGKGDSYWGLGFRRGKGAASQGTEEVEDEEPRQKAAWR